jgi:hypothetical protein
MADFATKRRCDDSSIVWVSENMDQLDTRGIGEDQTSECENECINKWTRKTEKLLAAEIVRAIASGERVHDFRKLQDDVAVRVYRQVWHGSLAYFLRKNKKTRNLRTGKKEAVSTRRDYRYPGSVRQLVPRR